MTENDRFRRCAGRLAGKVRRTCRRWDLVPPGARIALGISGGVDSLAMVLLLTAINRSLRQPAELLGLHVALDAKGLTGGSAEDVRSLCGEHGVELVDVPPRMEADEEPPFDCFRCAQIRRRTLLEEADRRGRRIVALGHHADDVVETWLMSLFYTGSAETIPPRRSYFDGAVTLIRPLYELRKVELERLLRLRGAPMRSEGCPRTGHSKRDRVRQALTALGRDQRPVRRQLYWRAVRDLG